MSKDDTIIEKSINPDFRPRIDEATRQGCIGLVQSAALCPGVWGEEPEEVQLTENGARIRFKKRDKESS